MKQKIEKIQHVNGELSLPGDKSISHRAVMFSSMAFGTSTIENISSAEDVNSTIKCFRILGCKITNTGNLIEVTGRGFKGFTKPDRPLDCGNSGTTTRLILGILAAQNFESTLIGDESLSKRPMKRVIEPLGLMGARFKDAEKFTLPVTVLQSENLHAIDYKLQVASAQVKSALLIAGLHMDEKTLITEQTPTRNHTENLLGLKVENTPEGTKVYSSKDDYPKPGEYFVPSDISTAAFFMVLTLISENSELTIKNIGLNKSRTGVIEILKAMGARIEISNEKTAMGETYGDVRVLSSRLVNCTIPEKIIPNIIDEIPILSVAGLFAEGTFKVSGAKELRYKESDRINSLIHNYRMLGLEVNESPDGFEFTGEIKNKAVCFESFDDHRIAMAFAILSTRLELGAEINNFECVGISNPQFLSQLKSVAV